QQFRGPRFEPLRGRADDLRRRPAAHPAPAGRAVLAGRRRPDPAQLQYAGDRPPRVPRPRDRLARGPLRGEYPERLVQDPDDPRGQRQGLDGAGRGAKDDAGGTASSGPSRGGSAAMTPFDAAAGNRPARSTPGPNRPDSTPLTAAYAGVEPAPWNHPRAPLI